MDIKTVIHVGPAPNIIPATFKRLSENVRAQNSGFQRRGMRAVISLARRSWLSKLLPKRSALLRAPKGSACHSWKIGFSNKKN